MIYIVVGLHLDKKWYYLTGSNTLEYTMTSYNAGYTGYQKLRMYLLNIEKETLILLAEK